jgi:3-hydroxyacyl-[acyl-carrier-protein] dehydratase
VSSVARTHAAAVSVPTGHPCFAGHFPDRPIVPAVVLLDCVLREAESWLGTPVTAQALAQAKFTAPLLPDQSARLELELDGTQLRFNLTRDTDSIARGTFTIAPGADG